VLIVDDNQGMRTLMTDLVRTYADEIVLCSNGLDALKAFPRCRPDWVLMDVEMHPMDGLTATKEICASYPSARIAIVTQNDNVSTREKARQAGASAFVPKENLLQIRDLLRPGTGSR